MEKKQIIEDMTAVFRNCEGNVISGEIALEGCEGLVMFEEPVFGVSSADDSIYREFLKKDVEDQTEVHRKKRPLNGCMPG